MWRKWAGRADSEQTLAPPGLCTANRRYRYRGGGPGRSQTAGNCKVTDALRPGSRACAGPFDLSRARQRGASGRGSREPRNTAPCPPSSVPRTSGHGARRSGLRSTRRRRSFPCCCPCRACRRGIVIAGPYFQKYAAPIGRIVPTVRRAVRGKSCRSAAARNGPGRFRIAPGDQITQPARNLPYQHADATPKPRRRPGALPPSCQDRPEPLREASS